MDKEIAMKTFTRSVLPILLLLDLAYSAEALFAADAFDPQGGEHIAVYRPSNGTFYVRNRATGAIKTQQWGIVGDIPVPADYDGDGTTDFAVFRPSEGTWWVIKSSNGEGHFWYWGQAGDVPVPGNYGASSDELAIWRPSNGTWYTYNINSQRSAQRQWGENGDKPLVGSYTTGGSFLLFPVQAYTVWRPSNKTFYINEVYGSKKPTRVFGVPSDQPIAADFNGDRVTDIAVWRPSNGTWYVVHSDFRTSPAGGKQINQQWGQAGDVPVARDFDSDGKADHAIWRPSNGMWHIIRSSNGTVESQQWGQVGDIPVPYHVASRVVVPR